MIEVSTEKRKEKFWDNVPFSILFFGWYLDQTKKYDSFLNNLFFLRKMPVDLCRIWGDWGVYLISSEGKWGRKSFPTKKHMNTQSSMALCGNTRGTWWLVINYINNKEVPTTGKMETNKTGPENRIVTYHLYYSTSIPGMYTFHLRIWSKSACLVINLLQTFT